MNLKELQAQGYTLLKLQSNTPPSVGWRLSQIIDQKSKTIRPLWIPPAIEPEVKKHPMSPLFNGADGSEKLIQALTAISSKSLSTANEELRDLLKQACYASLWFFMKGVASFGGPFDKLTDHLHVDMTNWYQSMMLPGVKAGGFIFRSAYKTTNWTSGANGWEILRDPNIIICLISGITSKALEMMATTEHIFDANEIMEWLFPELYVKNTNRDHWSTTEMISPGRTKWADQPTLKPLGVGVSAQGTHADLLKIDDIVGDTQLNEDRSAGAEMRKAGNWLMSNMNTLLMSPIFSRVFVGGTRYDVADPYEVIFKNMRSIKGADYAIPHKTKEDGIWDVYYRMAIEHELEIFPESVGKKQLMLMDEWTRMTQYYNNPYLYRKSEINNYEFGSCELSFEKGHERVIWTDYEGFEQSRYLIEMDLIQVADPAATEGSQATKRSSKSAHLLGCRDRDENYFIIRGNIGHKEIYTVYDWFFTTMRVFGKWIRKSGMEMKGGFKLLEPQIRREQRKRKVKLKFGPIQTTGDKDARIRAYLETPLKNHKLFVIDSEFKKVIQAELDVFPNGLIKDGLDVVAMFVQESREPRKLTREGQDWWSPSDVGLNALGGSRNKVTGY